MTLSPFEVERQEFGRSVGGYRRKEVDAFLDDVRATLVTLWEERADLREENERLGERVARFTALEEQLKNTLLLAQDSAEKATEQARREAELVLREASQKAREIVGGLHEERRRLEQTLRDLGAAEADSRQRFRALAQTVLAHLDESEESSTEALTTLRAMVQHGSHTGSIPAADVANVQRAGGGKITGGRTPADSPSNADAAPVPSASERAPAMPAAT